MTNLDVDLLLRRLHAQITMHEKMSEGANAASDYDNKWHHDSKAEAIRDAIAIVYECCDTPVQKFIYEDCDYCGWVRPVSASGNADYIQHLLTEHRAEMLRDYAE